MLQHKILKQTPKFQVNSSTQRDFHNVKMAVFYPHYNDNSTKVLTWDGHVFTTVTIEYGRAARRLVFNKFY